MPTWEPEPLKTVYKSRLTVLNPGNLERYPLQVGDPMSKPAEAG